MYVVVCLSVLFRCFIDCGVLCFWFVGFLLILCVTCLVCLYILGGAECHGLLMWLLLYWCCLDVVVVCLFVRCLVCVCYA